MALVGVRDYKSLRVRDVNGVDLPSFTLLTGTNGAGKSNLLEGIQQNAFHFEDLGALGGTDVRLFQLGQLLTNAEGPVQGMSYREPWAGLYNNVQSWEQQAPQHIGYGNRDAIEQWVVNQALSSQLISEQLLMRMKKATSKNLIDMELTEYREHFPLVGGVRDPFAASIAEVFLSYNERKIENERAEFVYEKYNEGDGAHLSHEAFIEKYGPKPWELLSETLSVVGLPYTFVPPPNAETTNYEVTLDNGSGLEIKPVDLSSGERVLLAVAMGLFTGTNMTEAIQLPKVLLLDEADASLHPSMVKSLLTVVQQIFVAQYGVRVIMASHSPSTVALAPEESLFVMRRTGERLTKSSTDEALQMLTVGISSLSVRVENRRQVFVESEYDQEIYQELFGLLKDRLKTDRSAEFIAAGKRDNGGGCDMVKRLVKDLRAAGVDSVFGIVDRDNRAKAPESVFYVEDRYSVENLLFDPIILGTFLLREGIVKPEEFGLPASLRSFQIKQSHADHIISCLSKKLGFDITRTTSIAYVGGFTAKVPTEFLETQGHSLEEIVLKAYPPLKAYKKQLKATIVKLAIADKPEFVPQSLIDVFDKIA